MNVLLISTYELGRQPFGLASPVAWLRQAGARVESLDLSVQRLDETLVGNANVVAFYLPMHTATRIALAAIQKTRKINPSAHLCAYGLYAPVNAELLRARGVQTILGGEFEEALVSFVRRLQDQQEHLCGEPAPRAPDRPASRTEPEVSLAKQAFLVPDRSGLPALSEYAHLSTGNGERRTVGYTEASRGCRHRCRHCPVVPVYDGQFRVVQRDVVLEDIRRQVAAGAEHITFGDPDFLNGPKHAAGIVRQLHDEHSELSYDVTIKVEHLLQHADLLPVLRDTGCAFVTTAVESVDDRVLQILDKGHTRADFLEVVARCTDVGLGLQPTFVAFTPWITLDGYADLLGTLARLGLIDNVPPIQLAIRLLIPGGSLLLELPEVRRIVGPFDEVALGHPWIHADPRVDALQRDIQAMVEAAADNPGRRAVFATAWNLLHDAMGQTAPTLPDVARPRATIPYLSEPWYC